jgi:dihydrofolate reductase
MIEDPGMKRHHLHAVVAMASNRVIGRDGRLPWHLPDDLRFFKRLTLGHPVVMGRRTFESIGRPLPGRRNIVLSRSLAPREGIEVIGDISALDRLGLEGPVFVIGGAEVYRQLLPRCESVYVSQLFAPCDGDALMPAFEGEFPAVETLERFAEFEVRHYRRAGAE